MNKSTSNIIKWFLAILVLFYAGESAAQKRTAQDTIPLRKDYSKGGFKIAIAYYQIESLRDGVLLVRLQTKQKAIDHYTEIGNPEAAERVKKKQAEANADIINAFKENYTFTNVYFFSSEYSDLVRDHKLDSVPFLDKHIVDRYPRDLAKTSFLIAEMTTLAPDTGTVNVNPYNYEGRKKKRASVSSNMGISALVFKSDQFVQLDTPFPYYVRGYTDFFKALIGVDWDLRKLNKIVAKANADLIYFSAGKDWRNVQREDYAIPLPEPSGVRKSTD